MLYKKQGTILATAKCYRRKTFIRRKKLVKRRCQPTKKKPGIGLTRIGKEPNIERPDSYLAIIRTGKASRKSTVKN